MKNKILFYIIFFFTIILYSQNDEDCWTLINSGIDIYNGQYNDNEFPGYHDPETTDLKEVTGGFLTTGQYNKQTFDSNDNKIYTNLENKDGGYLTKHDYNGNLQWIVYTEKNNNSYRDVMFGSVEDSQGNIYVIGHSINGTFFDSEGTEILFNNSYSLYGGFIVKLDQDGKILWHITIDNVYSKKINIDKEDNILLSGDVNIYNNYAYNFYLNGIITDNLSNFEIMGNNRNYTNRAILKINPDGELLWHTSVKTSGPNSEFLIDIGSDNSNNIYVAGYCSSQVDIYSAGDTNNPDTISWVGNPSKTFLIKFNEDGQFLWKVKSLLNDPVNNGVKAWSLTVDEDGNSYISGSNDSRNINSPNQIFENNDGSITSEHVGTFFIAKVNTNGICEWIKGAADSYNGTGYKVIKSNDEIIAVGEVNAFGDSIEDVEFLSTDGNNIEASFYEGDYFLAVYDVNGNVKRILTNGINEEVYFRGRISGFFKDANGNYYLSRNCYFYDQNPKDYINFGHIIRTDSGNGYDGTISKFNEECGIIIGNEINQNIIPLTLCDNESIGTDYDGLVKINLTEHENNILNIDSITDYEFNYYSDSSYTIPINNPREYQNTNQIETIYIDVIHSSDSSKSGQTSFAIEVFELPTVTPIVELRQCDDNTDGISLFNLEEVINEITTNAINETITFHETLTDATLGNSPISNTTNYSNSTASTDTVWARIVNENDCIRTSQVNLSVSTTEIPLTFTRDFYECDDDIAGTITDGISSFDFSTVTTEIETLFPIGQQLVITYYRNLADALLEKNSIIDITDYRNVGYPNSQNIYIRVDSLLDNDCLGLGAHINLYVEPIPIANPVTITRQCDDDFDGLYPFDTSQIEQMVLNGQTGMLVSYTDELGNPLSSPLPNPFVTASQTISISITDSNSKNKNGACSATTTLEFIVDKKPVANPVSDFIACDDDLDGIIEFDTSNIEQTLLNRQTGMVVSYVDASGTALSSPLPNPFKSASQTITAKVENVLNGNCFAETPINFIVHPKPQFELDSNGTICLNLPSVEFSIKNPNDVNYTYSWTNEQGQEISNLPTADINKDGAYTVVATSNYGCTSFPKKINVTASSIASITSEQIEITDNSDNNIIEIFTSNLGIGNYEFAIQKEGESIGFYQDEPIFENIPSGIYKVFVNDKNNCGEVNINISVIGYPKFFTPNGDGYNDFWQITGAANFPHLKTLIFDRYGKLLAEISSNEVGWNGLCNGKKMISNDYWFRTDLGNGQTFSGHFSLKR